jgi:hypothetical protein
MPAVLIKDDPAWSLAERMKFYEVPGSEHHRHQRLPRRLGASLRRQRCGNERTRLYGHTLSGGIVSWLCRQRKNPDPATGFERSRTGKYGARTG